MDDLKKLSDLIPILLFLLPGFVSSGIVEMLVVRKARDAFGKSVEAFIFTILNLILFAVLRQDLECIPGVRFDHSQFFTPGNLSLMGFGSVFIALCWALEATNEWCFELLRKLRFTRKTTKMTTWNETFVENQKFVVVHLKSGRRVYGWPKFYADDPTERAIFLNEASWLSADNTLLNVPAISIFLDKESGIEFIEFLDFGH